LSLNIGDLGAAWFVPGMILAVFHAGWVSENNQVGSKGIKIVGGD